MPLSIPYDDPTNGTLQSTYVYCSELHLNFATKSGRIVFAVHRDHDSAYAGKLPLGEIAFDLNATGLGSGGHWLKFDDVMASHVDVYNQVYAAVYDLAKAQPEFAGATDIP